LFRAVLRELDSLKESSAYSEELLEHTILLFKRRILGLQNNLDSSRVLNEEKAIRQLTRKVLEAERVALDRLRQEATIHDDIFFQLNLELDLEDARLRAQLI